LVRPDNGGDYLKIAHRLMDSLSNVSISPHPHFRIVPTALKENKPALWTIEDNTEIGYIFDDRNLNNRIYRTKIEFVLKIGLKSHVDASVVVEKYVEGKLCVTCQLNGSEPLTVQSDQKIVQLDIPVKIGEDARSISLKILKDFKSWQSSRTIFFKLSNETEMERLREGNERFDFGNLLDLRTTESADDTLSPDLSSIKAYGLLPMNMSADTKEISFCDYFIGTIPIPKPKSGIEQISTLNVRLQSDTGLRLDPLLVSYIESKIESKGGRLYDFQVRSIETIGKELQSERNPCVIVARTAAGKTEAFLIPIVNWLLELKRSRNPRGVKILVFYPTKALASDQLQRIVDLVYFLNKHLTNKITVGIYHGDIEERFAIDIPLPLRCVLHEQEIESGNLSPGQVRIMPNTATNSLHCMKCNEHYEFLMADRYSVTTKLPDILVCTPDVFNYILIKDPKRYSFLGKSVDLRICSQCTRVCGIHEETCSECNLVTKEITVTPEIAPQIVVLDELHLFNSIFGGNVSSLLKRINAAIRANTNNENKIQFIATSATIKNPIEFGKEFFGKRPAVVETSDDEYDYSDKFSKVVIFASPRAYRMVDTVAYSLFRILKDTDLKVLTFVNSLTEGSLLLGNVRQRLSSDQSTENLNDLIDGHNSTYNQKERADSEERFNKGELRALIATSTLEVGVDFKDLDCMILYGAPYLFNNFLQRIGRAGRKHDSIILTLLNPTNPIDLYYYRNARKITQDPTRFIEDPPFPSGNKMIHQKHVMSSLFDASNIFSIEITDIIRSFMNAPDTMDPRVKSYLESLWSQRDIQESSERIKGASLFTYGKKLSEEVIRHFRLLDLRKVDETIPVEFEEPFGVAPSSFRKKGVPPYNNRESKWRAAGVSRSDIEILKQLKGEK
jgi:superfamily II DNA/RNA helicase